MSTLFSHFIYFFLSFPVFSRFVQALHLFYFYLLFAVLMDSFALCIVFPLYQLPRNRFFSLLLYHLYWSYSSKLSSPHSILYNYIERVPGTKQSLPVPGTLLFKLSETIVFSQLLSKIGCSCSPLRAASTVSGILSKSAIRELGFKIALSCPKGTK